LRLGLVRLSLYCLKRHQMNFRIKNPLRMCELSNTRG